MKFSTVTPFALYALATAEEESTEFLTSFVTKYFTVSTTISLNSTTITLHTPAAVTFLDCLNQSSSANYTTSPTPSAEVTTPVATSESSAPVAEEASQTVELPQENGATTGSIAVGALAAGFAAALLI